MINTNNVLAELNQSDIVVMCPTLSVRLLDRLSKCFVMSKLVHLGLF